METSNIFVRFSMVFLISYGEDTWETIPLRLRRPSAIADLWISAHGRLMEQLESPERAFALVAGRFVN